MVLGIGNPEEDEQGISTLGLTSTIMILYNMVAWPFIYQITMSRTPIDKMLEESKRADALVQQIDLVCDFASSITNMIKNLNVTEDLTKVKTGYDSEHDGFMDYIITLIGSDRKVICRFKIRDDEDAEVIDHKYILKEVPHIGFNKVDLNRFTS